jgi:hypothetical protein
VSRAHWDAAVGRWQSRGRGLARVRWPLLVVLASAHGALVAARGSSAPTDYDVFSRAGVALLHGHVAAVYASPGNQGGPFELLVDGVSGLLDQLGAGLGWRLEIALGSLAVAVGLPLVARWLRRSFGLAPSPGLELVLGLLAIATSLDVDLAGQGHPAEVVIPLFWVVAARQAAAGKTLWAGALLGLAAGWETWGLLGVPIVLLAERRTRAVGCAGLVAAAAYLPFVATGHFRMTHYAWPVFAGSLPHALDPGLSHYPWSLRLVQAGAAVVVGALVARSLTSRPLAVWLVPLSAQLVRLFLDPQNYGYYWLSTLTLALVGIGLAAPRVRAGRVLLVVLGYLQIYAFGGYAAAGVSLVLVAALVAVDRSSPRRSPVPRPA